MSKKRKAWNKGLTKETSGILKEQGIKHSIKMILTKKTNLVQISKLITPALRRSFDL